MRLLVLVSLVIGGLGLGAASARLMPGNRVPTRGRVVDEQGQPVPGAVLRVIGRRRVGTSTDSEGRFLLRRPARRDSLTVSRVGYQTTRVAARDGQTITLREDTVVTEPLRDWLRRGGIY